jgi:aspartate/methionine/tyrosine aminotransferase
MTIKNHPEPEWIAKKVSTLHRVGSRVSNERAGYLKSRGVDIVKLSGTPITPPGENVIEAARKAANENIHPPSRGLLELREAIAQKLSMENKIDADPGREIMITNGAQHALFIAITGLIERGDEVIIPTPSYFMNGIVILAGGKPVYSPMKQEEGFKLDADKIEDMITNKTKLLLLTNPVNPTGYVATMKDLVSIAEMVERKNLFVICDESYEKIIFDGKKHISIASLKGMHDRIITVHSFSKSYAMAGWRVGYMFGPFKVVDHLIKIAEWMQLHGNYICQKAAAAAIKGPQDWVKNIRLDIENNRNILVRGLSKIDRISFVKPGATPNIFPNISNLNHNDVDISNFLLKCYGIRTEPGPAFNHSGHIRIQFCARKESIAELVRRLSQAVEVAYTATDLSKIDPQY